MAENPPQQIGQGQAGARQADGQLVFETMKSHASALSWPAPSDKLSGPVNVSKVRQLSPFRYPGGKTWLVPHVRRWVHSLGFRPRLFIEPFAGGAIASLTVAIENLADKIIMAELDPDVASVWKTILQEPEYLCKRILGFDVSLQNVRQVLDSEPGSACERAFQTIVRNRTQRGGILAPGASLVKSGENGKGLKSRWYPETLVKRIRTIHHHRQRIEFLETDASEIVQRHVQEPDVAFFIDPPYTAGGKKAGNRLYRFSEIDHSALFEQMASVRGEFLMTYDDAEEVRNLASKSGFAVHRVPMKNTHHAVMHELLITKA